MIPENDVVFVCVENTGRSQMAEAFFRTYAGNLRVASAGTRPGRELNPLVVEVMREIGIDLGSHVPKAVSDGLLQNSRMKVSMGCVDEGSCPALFVHDVVRWNVPDPSGRSIDEVRSIRDQIGRQVRQLVHTLQEA